MNTKYLLAQRIWAYNLEIRTSYEPYNTLLSGVVRRLSVLEFDINKERNDSAYRRREIEPVFF